MATKTLSTKKFVVTKTCGDWNFSDEKFVAIEKGTNKKFLWWPKILTTKTFVATKNGGNQKRLQPKSFDYGDWKPFSLPQGVRRSERVQFQSLLSLPHVAQYGFWPRLTLSWHDVGLHLCPTRHVTSWWMPKHYDNPGWIMFLKLKGKLLFDAKTLMFYWFFKLLHCLNNPISFWKIVVKKCNNSNLIYKRVARNVYTC